LSGRLSSYGHLILLIGPFAQAIDEGGEAVLINIKRGLLVIKALCEGLYHKQT